MPRGTAPDGATVAVHAVLPIDIVDGRICRLEEYLDPAQAADLSATAGAKREQRLRGALMRKCVDALAG